MRKFYNLQGQKKNGYNYFFHLILKFVCTDENKT